MTHPSAVARAVDALSVLVQRIADAMAPPPAAPTTGDDRPRCRCGNPIERAGGPAYWMHTPGTISDCLDARPSREDAVPPEIKAIVDRAAGRELSDTGPVMACLTEVLAAHRRIVLAEQPAGEQL